MGSLIQLFVNAWREMELNSLRWRIMMTAGVTVFAVFILMSYGAFAGLGIPGFTTQPAVERIVSAESMALRQEMTEQRDILNSQQRQLERIISLTDQSLQASLEMKIHTARRSQCQALHSDPRNQRAADAEERILLEARREYQFKYGRQIDIRPCEEY